MIKNTMTKVIYRVCLGFQFQRVRAHYCVEEWHQWLEWEAERPNTRTKQSVFEVGLSNL